MQYASLVRQGQTVLTKMSVLTESYTIEQIRRLSFVCCDPQCGEKVWPCFPTDASNRVIPPHFKGRHQKHCQRDGIVKMHIKQTPAGKRRAYAIAYQGQETMQLEERLHLKKAVYYEPSLRADSSQNIGMEAPTNRQRSTDAGMARMPSLDRRTIEIEEVVKGFEDPNTNNATTRFYLGDNPRIESLGQAFHQVNQPFDPVKIGSHIFYGCLQAVERFPSGDSLFFMDTAHRDIMSIWVDRRLNPEGLRIPFQNALDRVRPNDVVMYAWGRFVFRHRKTCANRYAIEIDTLHEICLRCYRHGRLTHGFP